VLISRRLDGELDAADVPLLDAHLKGCGACRLSLETWQDQSTALDENLATLWQPSTTTPEKIRSGSASRRKSVKPMKRCMWVPVGMIASQVVAFLGLSVYFLFFAQRAEAPQAEKTDQFAPRENPAHVSTAQPRPIDTEAVEISVTPAIKHVEPELVEPTINERPAADNIQTSEANDTPSSSVHAANDVKQEVVMAAIVERVPSKPLENISLEYVLPETRESGRITLLGDVLAGQGTIKLVDSAGRTTIVKQNDIERLLSPAQRTLVARLIEDCRRPDLKPRVDSAIRRASATTKN
jgi:hypothetical protein